MLTIKHWVLKCWLPTYAVTVTARFVSFTDIVFPCVLVSSLKFSMGYIPYGASYPYIGRHRLGFDVSHCTMCAVSKFVILNLVCIWVMKGKAHSGLLLLTVLCVLFGGTSEVRHSKSGILIWWLPLCNATALFNNSHFPAHVRQPVHKRCLWSLCRTWHRFPNVQTLGGSRS